jgi:hypothetical protein
MVGVILAVGVALFVTLFSTSSNGLAYYIVPSYKGKGYL